MFFKNVLETLGYMTAIVIWGFIILFVGTAIIAWACRTEQEDTDAKWERQRRRLSIREFFKRVFMTKTEREIYCYFGFSKRLQREARKQGLIDLDGMLKAYKGRIQENIAMREADKDIFEEYDALAEEIMKHQDREGNKGSYGVFKIRAEPSERKEATIAESNAEEEI